MGGSIKRLRVFAGPNGSGKSTLVKWLSKERADKGKGLFHLHRFINADEIANALNTSDGCPWDSFHTTMSWDEMRRAIIAGGRVGSDHPFLRDAKLQGGKLIGPISLVDDYLPAAIADTLRADALSRGDSFSFETVMSHVSKVEFMEEARAKGYKVYLYFVATETPDLNVDRIVTRVAEGGHNVPRVKIAKRFDRCLQLLPRALNASDRAYLFDNSGQWPEWLGEKTADGRIELRSSAELPAWFVQYVMASLTGNE